MGSLQNIILSKYLAEQPKQSKKISESVFNKYDLKDKSFTNMALMQIKTAGDDIEFANYADVYYGVRVKKYNNKTKDFDYPMFTTQKLFTVNPVKGGAVGGLYDWAANQFDITYKPTTKIKYNELFDVTNDITGQHKALIELYKLQGGYPTLLNGGRGISLLVKTVASGAAGEKVMKSVKDGLEKIQKSLDNAENIVYGVDAGLSIVEAGLDIFEFFDKDLEDTIKPYRDYYSRAKKVVTDAYGILKIKPYSPNVKDFGELKQLKQLLGGVIAVVPSNSKNSATREILQNKIDNISDKQVEFKVIGTALLLNKIIEPLIKSSAEGRQAIKDFNTKYENTISFSQVAYYMGLRIKGKIKEREIGGKIHQAIAEYSRTFISKKVFKSVKTTLSKYMNAKAQIPKAIGFMKKIVTGGTKFIKDPLKAMVSIGTFLIEAEIVNLKAIGGDAILSVIAKANPAGAAVKGAQVVNDWSSYLAGNVAVANKQYFQVDFDNGKVDIHLPSVTFSGVSTDGNIRPLKSVQNYFKGTDNNSHRFLVAVDEKSYNVQHKPKFDMFFTEENKDGIFIDGDFEDLLETTPYKNKTIFKFDLNIEKSNIDNEDVDSFSTFGAEANRVKNVEIKSEHIISADLKSGARNTSYLDIMEAWEKKSGAVYVTDKTRGLFKESVTVEMMASTNPEFIIEGNLRQKSISYYAYKVAEKSLIEKALTLSIEEDKDKNEVLSIKNNASYTICYEVKYDIEDGLIDKVDRRQGNCIASGKTFVDSNLDLYSDGTGKMNDVQFYFYDELAVKFFQQELIAQPYLYHYQKRTKKVISNIIAYSIDFDEIDNNRLPAQIDKENINISVTDTEISLSWINLVDVTSYQACMSKNPIVDGNKCEENGGILIKNIDSQSASININKNLENNTLYYFRVVGVRGGINGLWSDETSIKFEGVEPFLNAPTNVKVISTTNNITLNWTKLKDISTYEICMSESAISDGSKCTENGGKLIGVTATLKTISEGLKKDTTYYFRVRGIKSGFEALWSDEVMTKLKEQTLVNPGTVKGSVIDAVTNKVVSANIAISTEEGEEVKTLTTDSDGKYTLSLSEGNYIFSVKATGYISELMTVTVKHKETTVVSSLRQIPNSAKGDGVAKGKIIDALSGENLASVTLKARKGINSKKGTVVATEYSDGDGEFSFDLEAGNYTVEATADGYISIYFELLVIGKETTAKQNASMTPNIQSGEVRVILSWGDKPGDLDSHINTPTIDGYWYHVYWEKRGSQYYAPYTKLDVDRSDFANSSSGTTSRSGPETITLYKSKTGIYHYYVFNFSEGTSKGRSSSIQGSLVNSRATVKVYGSTGLIKTFTVPNGGVGNYWDVFTYDGGTGKITTVNTIINSKPN